MVVSLRNVLTCIMMVFAVACPCTSAKETEGVLEKFHEQFDSLDGRGKFWVGAAAGFVGSRLSLSSAVTVVKVAGVAFVTTEVLHYTGLLEELPRFSEEQTDMMQDLKGGIMKRAEGFRVQVRRRLNPVTVKKFVADEKSVTLGAAGGAILGFML